MSVDPEPFFTPSEWKATTLLRPRDWRQWWRTEPLTTKLFAVALAALLGVGIYLMRKGEPSGWPLIYVVVGLLIILLLIPFLVVFIAGVRWVLRQIGVVAWWRRVRERVFTTAKVVFWLWIIGTILAALWPYMSLDPVKSWYALTNKVPVERVVMEKKPHDCEFATAPLGSKHCHYDAKAFVIPATENADGRRSLVVSYEKVED
jgi:hypothetical protein